MGWSVRRAVFPYKLGLADWPANPQNGDLAVLDPRANWRSRRPPRPPPSICCGRRTGIYMWMCMAFLPPPQGAANWLLVLPMPTSPPPEGHSPLRGKARSPIAPAPRPAAPARPHTALPRRANWRTAPAGPPPCRTTGPGRAREARANPPRRRRGSQGRRPPYKLGRPAPPTGHGLAPPTGGRPPPTGLARTKATRTSPVRVGNPRVRGPTGRRMRV